MRDNDSIRKKLSRRKYAKLVAGSGMAAMAGCPSDGGSDTDTPTEEPTEGTDTDGSTPTDTSTPNPENRMRDTARVYVNNSPDEFNWNPHIAEDLSPGDLYMSELYGFINVHDASKKAHGDQAVFESPWVHGHDEIDVVTWVKEWSVEEPYDMYNTHDERSTYWNGEPYDAIARYKYDKVRYFAEGNKYAEGAIHRAEATSQWDYHYWNSRGEVANADDTPQNATVLGADAATSGGNPPLPPEWSDPWIRQFEGTASEEAYQSKIEELRGDRVSLERIAENGWGSGPYELRSTDDIASDRAILRLRDSSADTPHPHREHITVPNLQLQFGNADREQVLANNGEIDAHQGSITPNNQWNPESLPSHIENITTYLKSNGGDSWWFNWNNPHLQNLWVRRALATIVDWHQVGANGWGPQRSVPLEYDTGTLDSWSKAIFSDEFLDSLHVWPKEADEEAATEYMQKAGYTKEGGVWTSPEGNKFSLDILIPSNIGDWVGAGKTIKQNLSDFGIQATFTQQTWGTWTANLDTFSNENAPNYETSIHWFNPSTQFQTYKSQAAWWDNGSLIGGDPNGEGGDRRSVEPDDEWTITGEPVTVHLPTDPSSIEAPDQAGAKPSLEGVTEYEEVNIAEVMNNLRKPADSKEAVQERFQKCARYYNYYLPKFVFHQYTYGEWANVRDFVWPEEDDPALDWSHDFNITDTITLGGIMQANYEE